MSHLRRAIACIATLTLAGCGTTDLEAGGSGGIPVSGGTFVDLATFAAGDPTNIDPALASDVQSAQIADLLYDGLTAANADGNIENAVAKSFSANSDATQWTFTLRDDVVFSNGETVEPSDFKAAWERALDPTLASRLTGRFDGIVGSSEVTAENKLLSGVVADDTLNTLTVSLDRPNREFPALVSLPVFSPLPKNPAPTAEWQNGVMVGNGPFVMSEPWSKGQFIRLGRNGRYYGGPENHLAYVENLEFRISQSVDSAYTEFTTGGGQLARIPGGQYGELKMSAEDRVLDSPLMGTEFWGFNMADPVVGGPQNLKLRQAIAAAIDKPDLNTKVYNGSRQVATAFAPPVTPGYEGINAETSPDLTRARSLIAEAGAPVSPIKVSYNAGAGHEDKAAVIVANLNAAGIPAVNDPLENQAYRQAVMGGTLQFFRFAWIADYISYDNMLAPSFLSTSIGEDNVIRYNNSEFDRLVIEARGLSDEDRRHANYRLAEKLVLDDQAVVPLTWVTAGLIAAPRVNNLRVNPLGYVDYSEAWIAQ